MTDEEPRTLTPGAYIHLIARIGSDDGFWFVPQEVEGVAGREDG